MPLPQVPDWMKNFMVPKNAPVSHPATSSQVAPNTQQTQTVDPNANIDPNKQKQNNQGGDDTAKGPMAAYDKLFTTAAPDDKAPKAPQFNLTPEVTNAAANGLDFTAGLPDEVVAAIDSGAPVDGKTLRTILNHVGRGAYSHSMQHASSLTNKFVDISNAFHTQHNLPKHITDQLVKNKARSHPNLKDPVAKQHFERIVDNFRGSYPDASPDELVGMAQSWIADLAKNVSGDTTQTDANPNDLEFDHAAYLKDTPATRQ